MKASAYGLLAPRVTMREVSLWVFASLLMLFVHVAGLWAAHQWQQTDPMESVEAAPALNIELAPMLVAPDAVPLDMMAEIVDSAEVVAEEVPPEAIESEAIPAEEALPEEVVGTHVASTAITHAEPVDEALTEETMDIPPVAEPSKADSVPVEQTEPARVAETTAAPTIADMPPPEVVPPEQEATETVPVAAKTISETVIAEANQNEIELPELVEIVPSAAPQQTPPQPTRTAAKQETAEPKRKQAEEKETARKPPPRQTKRQQAAPSVAARKSAQNAAKTAAPKASQQSRSTGVSPARWQSRVVAHINRHKRAPKGTRGSGNVTVSFAIDPNGRVLTASVSKSSGNPAFDQAALEMLQRASPVPAPPPEVAKPRLKLTVPVRFARR